MSGLDEWLKEKQAVALDPQMLKEAARSSRRIGTLAREAALELPFDTDPHAFWRVFGDLASHRRDD
jgi:hypothetical protein